MSSFTYEIDERNLRLQLKDFRVPLKEDAWQKFEALSEPSTSQHRERVIRSFNFSLNRSVILPSIFGIVIILFSFLLVNFVSIKTPARDNDHKAEAVSTVSAPENQPKLEQAVPVTVKEEQSQVAAEAQQVPDIKPEEKAMITSLVSAPETAVTETVAPSETHSDSVANTPITQEEPKVKKRRRRTEAVESQQLLEIRPTPVSEERDAEEIRPD